MTMVSFGERGMLHFHGAGSKAQYTGTINPGSICEVLLGASSALASGLSPLCFLLSGATPCTEDSRYPTDKGHLEEKGLRENF